MDFRDRLCYDLVWETTEKWFEPSTLCSAYFVDAGSFSKAHLGRQNYIVWERISSFSEVQNRLMSWNRALGEDCLGCSKTLLPKPDGSWMKPHHWKAEKILIGKHHSAKSCICNRQKVGAGLPGWPPTWERCFSKSLGNYSRRSFFKRLGHRPGFASFFVPVIKFYFM